VVKGSPPSHPAYGMMSQSSLVLIAKKRHDSNLRRLLGHESIKITEKHYSKWMKGRQDLARQSCDGHVEVKQRLRVVRTPVHPRGKLRLVVGGEDLPGGTCAVVRFSSSLLSVWPPPQGFLFRIGTL
jgi:hypothetical protein